MATEDNRRFSRRHCALPIEMRAAGSRFAVKAETSDLSPGGCYVRSFSTFEPGTALELLLCVGATSASFRGTVTTADPTVGNGIEFTEIPDEIRQRLQNYLDEIQAPEATSGIILR